MATIGAIQFLYGIHMLGLKRFLHNRRIRGSGYRYSTQNGDSSCDLVYAGILRTVCTHFYVDISM